MHKHVPHHDGLTLGAALAQAAESIQVAGELTCKTTEQHAVPVEGDPGHVLVVQKVTCSGSATGQSARFDGGSKLGSKLMIWSKAAG
jgi:hypothetical protein